MNKDNTIATILLIATILVTWPVFQQTVADAHYQDYKPTPTPTVCDINPTVSPTIPEATETPTASPSATEAPTPTDVPFVLDTPTPTPTPIVQIGTAAKADNVSMPTSAPSTGRAEN